MLLQNKGDKASCDNYHGITMVIASVFSTIPWYLIHPLGHLCAKVLEYRLLDDPNATQAIS